MNGLDRVWERLHERAKFHAQSGILLNRADARRIVGYLCSEFAERPSEDTIEDLAGALVHLTMEATENLYQRRRRNIHGIA